MAASRIKNRKGQSIIEILIAVSVGALIVASAASALIFTVRSNQQNRSGGTASSLAQELLDNVRSVAEANWQNIYGVDPNSKGGPTQACPPYCFYLPSSGTPPVFTVTSGSETLPPVNGITYTRYFTIENVNRTSCGTGDIATSTESASCNALPSDILEDPSTQKITAKVTWGQGSLASQAVVSEYITRVKNEVSQFTDWTGTSGTEGPISQPGTGYSSQSGLDISTTPGSVMLLTNGSAGGNGMTGSHWDAVNDSSADDDYTNYIYSFSASEQIDWYTLQNAFIVQPDRTDIAVYVQGGGCLSSFYLRIGASVTAAPQAGGCYDLGDPNSTRPGRVHHEYLGRPGGGAWTQTDVDNLEVGVGIKKAPDGSPGALARVYVQSRIGGEIIMPESDMTTAIDGVYYVSGDTYTGHWGKVDEPLADSVSYVYTPSVTEKRDTYTLNDTSVSGTTINSVIVRMYSHGCNPRPSLKLGASEVFDESGAGACDRPDFRSNWDMHESAAMLRPGGGSWVWADLNNLQVGAGIRRDDVFGYNGEVSAVYVIVNYNSGLYLILRPDGDVTTNIENAVP